MTIRELRCTFTVDVHIDGPEGVETILDVCFGKGGTLEGAVPAFAPDVYFLKEASARLTLTIE